MGRVAEHADCEWSALACQFNCPARPKRVPCGGCDVSDPGRVIPDQGNGLPNEPAPANRAVSWRVMLRNFARMISPLDVLYHLGTLVYRRSLRYTLFTAGIGAVGVTAKGFNLPGLTLKQAVLLPLCVGLAALVGGGLLRLLPAIISSRMATLAQANDLDLMEDHRKSLVREHLACLWERVFVHEMRVRAAGGQLLFKDFAYRRDEPVEQVVARAQPAFVERAIEALDALLPQVRQMDEYGLDLRYLEDWRDGACLDPSDTKLAEQFEGSTVLLAARAQAGLTGLAMLRYKPRLAAQHLWFLFVTRSVGYRVGSAIQALNIRYDTDLFNAQVLMWPGEEDARWVAQFPGAREEILRRRRLAMRRVFGPTRELADEVIDHMFYGGFAMASELRVRYDAEYCLGLLGGDPLDDLRLELRRPREFARARRIISRALQDRSMLDALLAAHRAELLRPERAEGLRAVRIAFHVDRDHLRRLVLRAANDDAQAAQAALEIIDRADRDRVIHSRRLLAVRMHHALTRLARQSYRDLVHQLAYDQE